MSEGMTICPECGAALETQDQAKDLPIQVLAQSCPDCDYNVDIAIINYKPGQYEVVAPALRGDSCSERISPNGYYGIKSCGRDAMIRIQHVGDIVRGRCAEHMGAHRETALDMRSDLP